MNDTKKKRKTGGRGKGRREETKGECGGDCQDTWNGGLGRVEGEGRMEEEEGVVGDGRVEG